MDWSPFTTATPTAKYTGLSGISIIYQHLWPVWWISHCSYCLDFKHFNFFYFSRSYVGDTTQKPSSSSFVLCWSHRCWSVFWFYCISPLTRQMLTPSKCTIIKYTTVFFTFFNEVRLLSISFSSKHSHLLSMHQKFCNTIKRQSLKSVLLRWAQRTMTM